MNPSQTKNFPTSYDEAEERIDIRYYLDVIKRRLWILIAVFATVTVSAAVHTFRQTPIYRTMSTLIIEQEIMQQTDPFGSYYTFKALFLQTQVDLIRSDKVMKKAVALLGLPDSQQNIAALKGRVNVKPVENTYLVNISISGQDPHQITREANAVADAFIQYSMEDKQEASRDSYTWLSEQLAVLKAKVKKSELELLKFKQQESIVSLEKRQSLIEENLSATHRKLMEASMKSLELKTTLDELKKHENRPELMESLPQILESESVGALKSDLSRLNVELAKLSRKYKPKHPKIVTIKTQINRIRQRLIDEIQKQVKGIEIEYQISKTNEEAIARNLDTLKRESMELSHQAIQYGVLKREAESNNQMFTALLGSMKKVDVTASMTPKNIRLVDAAKVPSSPISPDNRRNLLMGVALGLGLGLGLCFLAEYMDDTIKDENDLLTHIKGNFLGLVSKENRKKIKGIQDLPDSLIQSYRNIKTILTFYKQEHVLKTIMVTSSMSGEGKTTTVAALGRLFAESGIKVLIIEADLFRPQLRKLMHIESEIGLSDYFLHDRKKEDIIFETDIANLSILPSGLIPPNPRIVVESEKLPTLLKELNSVYDLIIIDTPPLNAFIEISFLCPLVDGVAMVVKAQKTTRQMVKKMMGILTAGRANMLGFILSQVPKTRHEKYYYYSHYYYYRKK